MSEIPIPKAEVLADIRLIESLLNEKSERSFAIVASARIETLLRDAVRASTGQSDLGFAKSVAVLKTMGLVDDTTAQSLRWFWEIRCKFAHNPNECSFADGEVAKLFAKLHEATKAHLKTAADSIEEKILCDISRQLGRTALPGCLPGTKETRFLVFVFSALALHLLAARSLAPKPSEPPEFAVFTFTLQ